MGNLLPTLIFVIGCIVFYFSSHQSVKVVSENSLDDLHRFLFLRRGQSDIGVDSSGA